MKTINKTFAMIAFLAMVFTISVNAQQCGVFKTYADYKIGKMNNEIKCGSINRYIRYHQTWDKDFITVIQDGKQINLKTSEVWGFRLSNGDVFRFQGKEYYPLEDKGTLWIYVKQIVQSTGTKTGGKVVPIFYFSKEGNGEIKELTLNNVKAAFPDNTKLQNSLSKYFPSDDKLDKYDTKNKDFIVNQVLENLVND